MGAVVLMMGIVVLDVLLRLFRRPLPGAYDMVSLLGAVVISFALAYTAVEKGHITVEFLVDKLSSRMQGIVEAITGMVGAAFFAMAAWQCIGFAGRLKASGEVSLTIQIPTYPFVLGIAVGCSLLSLVLLLGGIKAARRGGKE